MTGLDPKGSECAAYAATPIVPILIGSTPDVPCTNALRVPHTLETRRGPGGQSGVRGGCLGDTVARHVFCGQCQS